MNASLNLNFTQLLNITTRFIVTTKAPPGPPIVFDKSSLSTKFQDITNVFVLPAIAAVGVILTILKIIVLADKSLQGRMYQYFLLSSIFDFTKLFSSVFLALFRCGTLCPFGYNYYSKLYEQFIYLYVGNNSTVYGTLLDIVASIDRLLSFNPKQSKASDRFLSFRVKCILLFILTLCLNYPEYILTRSVIERARLIVPITLTNRSTHLSNSSSSLNLTIGNKTTTTTTTPSYYLESLFVLADNDLAKLIPIKTSLLVLNLIRKLTLLSILLIVNIIIGIKFREHMKKKRTMTSTFSNIANLRKNTIIEPTQMSSTGNETNATVSTRVVKSSDKYGKSEQAVTKMIMIMCISTFFGNILDSFTAILFSIVDSTTYNYYLLFSNATLFSVHAFDILLLYNFNNSFRAQFNSKFACLASNESVELELQKKRTNTAINKLSSTAY